VEEALRMVSGSDPDEVFCIGGAQIYRLFLPYCDTALITRIDHVYDADAFLPDLDQAPEWVKTGESDEQVFFHLTYHFCTYKRRSS
jgi:dihydrofolate reductase